MTWRGFPLRSSSKSSVSSVAEVATPNPLKVQCRYPRRCPGRRLPKENCRQPPRQDSSSKAPPAPREYHGPSHGQFGKAALKRRLKPILWLQAYPYKELEPRMPSGFQVGKTWPHVIKFLNMSYIACNMLSNHEYLLNWKFVQSPPSSLQSAPMASVQDTAALMACFASAASFCLGHIDAQTSKCATRISCFLFRPFSYDSVPCTACFGHMLFKQHADQVTCSAILPPRFSSCHWRIVG